MVSELEEGGADWRPEILVSDELDRVAERLQVDRQDVEDWQQDNRLRRLVESVQ